MNTTTERNRRRRKRRTAQNRLEEILKADGQAAHKAPQKRRQTNRDRYDERCKIILRSLLIRLSREIWGTHWKENLQDMVPSSEPILSEMQSTADELGEKCTNG